MVVWEIMRTDIQFIKQKLESCIKNDMHFSIIDEFITDSQITLTIDPINGLSIEIDEDGVTVLYDNEHEEFWLKPYKNEDDLIKDVIDFVIILTTNTVLFNYVYSGSKLLSYKIWIVDKKGEQRKFLKKVTTSLNPFLWLKPKTVVPKELRFRDNI